MSGPAETPPRHAWVWPAAVVGSLALFVAMYLTVISIAGRDPHFSVEPDYYEQSMRWDETAAQLRANQALGWSVEVEPDAQAGTPTAPAAPSAGCRRRRRGPPHPTSAPSVAPRARDGR